MSFKSLKYIQFYFIQKNLGSEVPPEMCLCFSLLTLPSLTLSILIVFLTLGLTAHFFSLTANNSGVFGCSQSKLPCRSPALLMSPPFTPTQVYSVRDCCYSWVKQFQCHPYAQSLSCSFIAAHHNGFIVKTHITVWQKYDWLCSPAQEDLSQNYKLSTSHMVAAVLCTL